MLDQDKLAQTPVRTAAANAVPWTEAPERERENNELLCWHRDTRGLEMVAPLSLQTTSELNSAQILR